MDTASGDSFQRSSGEYVRGSIRSFFGNSLQSSSRNPFFQSSFKNCFCCSSKNERSFRSYKKKTFKATLGIFPDVFLEFLNESSRSSFRSFSRNSFLCMSFRSSSANVFLLENCSTNSIMSGSIGNYFRSSFSGSSF